MATVDISYLIPQLRLRIGDLTPTAYRYTDEWLIVSLKASLSFLSRWWREKYLLDASEYVYRNPLVEFDTIEPPVIEYKDEHVIVLASAYILLEGSLENSAWDFVSWKDAEISVSNLESARSRGDNLKRLWEELMSTLTPPTKKLATPHKNSLPGYKFNIHEHEGEY